jgi:DNA-binding Lrp family transcriptional regulator
MSKRTERLTERQRETIAWVADFIDENGMPPTVREIGRAFGIKSSSVAARIKTLERKGYLRRSNLGARSLVIVDRFRVTQGAVRDAPNHVKRQQLQPPYRQQDLLAVHDFITYCYDRGIRTDVEQLEYYDKSNLLLPAIKVKLPSPKKRESQPKPAVSEVHEMRTAEDLRELLDRTDEIEYGGHDWLDAYSKNGWVKFPSESDFGPWIDHDNPPRFGDPPSEEVFDGYMRFYSKYQIFFLWRIQKKLTVKLGDAMLFSDDKGWLTVARAVRTRFTYGLRALQEGQVENNRMLSLLNEILNLMDEKVRQADEEYTQSLKRGLRKKEAMKDAEFVLNADEDGHVAKRAREILKQSGYEISRIDNIRRGFVNGIGSLDPTRRWYEYLDLIPESALERSHGEYKFVRECHRVADQLGWFLERLGHKPPSIKEMKVGGREYRICPYCDKHYIKRSNSQVTCGNQRCVADHKNALKRLQRKMGT